MKPPIQSAPRGAAAVAAALLACTAGAIGLDISRLLPDAEVTPGASLGLPGAGEDGAVEGGESVLLDSLNGIRLVDVDGWTVPVPKPARLESSLGERVGQPLTLGGLIEIADLIVAHYREQGVPVVEVMVTEQEITDGQLEFVVAEGKVGDVALAGGEHFDAGRLARGVRSREGDTLTTRALYGDLDWLTRNRFLDAGLTVAPGEGLAEADLLFTVSDRRPLRVFGGFENSGVEVVGEERWLGGFEWGDVFGLGHRMVYQATVGRDAEAFRAHALDYRAPLPWRHELGFQAAIARSEVALDSEFADSTTGTSWLLGAGYTVPLPRAFGGALRHELTAGFEWKSTDNNLESGGAEVFASAAEIGQFSLRYSGGIDRGRGGDTAFSTTLLHAPGDLGGDNTDRAFAGIRGDAVSAYTVARGAVRHTRRLDGGSALVLRAGGQWTDAPLLPSEQLALGGHDLVRGYGEREGLGDLGYYGSLEFRAPPLEGAPGIDDRLQLLGFIDYGRSWAKGDHADGGGADTEFASAGPGLRYRIAGRASLRFDYGWRLDGGGSRGHIGVRVEF